MVLLVSFIDCFVSLSIEKKKHPWVKGIQFYSNEGPGPFSRGDNNKSVKIY